MPLRVRAVADLAECREVWERVFPEEFISDLWEFRACFQRSFQRPPLFLVAEDESGVCGLLPLSWIEEAHDYGYFPGETWEGKTWLEQNRILARTPEVLHALLAHCPKPYHLRYLLPIEAVPASEAVTDEIGYLFLPPQYDYDIEKYFASFSRKFERKLRRDLGIFDDRGVTVRLDDLADYDILVQLNISRFGSRSYFADQRFTESFREVMHLLHERGWVRMTTILVGGVPAAVDMGCAYRGVYTLLAGGTHNDYIGVAKVINVTHMKRACSERLDRVDFLCGDFAWKPLFRLTPRPLYLLSNVAAAHAHAPAAGSEACVS
jgi:hypothetical protein